MISNANAIDEPITSVIPAGKRNWNCLPVAPERQGAMLGA